MLLLFEKLPKLLRRSLRKRRFYSTRIEMLSRKTSLPLRMTASWRGVEGAVPYGVYEYNIVCRRGGFHIRPLDEKITLISIRTRNARPYGV